MKNHLLLVLMLAGVSPHACSQSQIGSPSGQPTPLSISVSLSPSAVAVGTTTILTATAVMSDASQNQADQTKFCNWSSSSPSVASIQQPPTNPGVYTATGVTAGSSTITCTTSWGSGSTVLTVVAAPAITNPTCGSPPCILPQGLNGVLYSGFTFASSGCPGSNTWTVTVGTINTGLALSGAGVISGTPSVNGTSTFTVTDTCSGGGTPTVQVSLTVIANAGQGPPLYNGTPSNVAASFAPSVFPFSGLGTSINGVDGTAVATPEPGNAAGLYANKMFRVTNSQTFCGGGMGEPACNVGHYLNDSGTVDGAGSSDADHFNTDDTMFDIADEASGIFHWFYSMTAAPLAVTLKYSTYTAGGKPSFDRNGAWSHTNNHTRFGITEVATFQSAGTELVSWDLSSTYPTMPAVTSLFDMSWGGSLFATTNVYVTDPVNVNNADNIFSDAFQATSASQTGRIVAQYDNSGVAPKGYAWNTSTGAYTSCISGHGGTCSSSTVQCQNCTGGATNPGTFAIHNIKATKNGHYILVAPQSCDAGSVCYNASLPYIFEASTGKVWVWGGSPTSHIGGHWTEGYTHLINQYDRGKRGDRVAISGLSSPTLLTTNCAYPATPQDAHFGWGNIDVGETNYFIGTTTTAATNPNYANCMENEIIGVAPANNAAPGTIKRFGHTYGVPTPCFGAEQGTSSVSQTGKFLLFTTPMNGLFGATNGSATPTISASGACTNSLAPRGDVILLVLN